MLSMIDAWRIMMITGPGLRLIEPLDLEAQAEEGADASQMARAQRARRR